MSGVRNINDSRSIQFDADAGRETNPTVQGVQQGLNRLSGVTPLREDGVFDAQTSQALRQFQTAHGLTASGAINQETINALNQVLTQGKHSFADCPTPIPHPAETQGRVQEQTWEGMLTKTHVQESAARLLSETSAQPTTRADQGIKDR